MLGVTALAAALTSAGIVWVPAVAAAAGETDTRPYAVEDFNYPNAPKIQQEQGIVLRRGNGGLVMVDCAQPWDIQVETRVDGGRNFCFDALRPDGYITMEIFDTFGIWTEDVAVRAKLTANGQTTTVDIPKDAVKPIGETDLPSGGKRSVLAELRVTSGPPAAVSTDPALGFTGTLNIGDGKRSCTATLVDPSWVLAAKSCFGDNPRESINVAAGTPKEKTILTLGAHITDITELAPRTDRDVLLARLARPASAITPVPVSSKAPSAGEELTVAGYGRTKSEWRPATPHKGAFSLSDLTTTGFDATPTSPADAVVCAGDAGGPVLRTEDGKPVLAAIVSRAGQKGCLGNSADTPASAQASRLDDIVGWIQQRRLADLIPDLSDVRTLGDFNNDGRDDIAVVTNSGNLIALYGRADGTFEYGRPLAPQTGAWKIVTRIVAGDFNGDGHTDLAGMWSNGSINFYPGDSKGMLGGYKAMWPDQSFGNVSLLARYKYDNSGRDGLIAGWNNGELSAYRTGTDGLMDTTKRKMWPDPSWKTMLRLTTGDFNGDARDDVIGITQKGALTRFDGNTAGGLNSGAAMWPDPSWSNTKIMAGDVDGDGRSDLLGWWSNRLNLYRGDGKGNLSAATNAWPTAL
ncbi:FG-GAP-like repeat-containing protein [Streptomyces sp. NPDC060010]|uniref:FG-GAP-like repeat-containing protein n=1 Tax=Streptomyces sp. NPDC060010 TaxID=3347036 RepID=UPI0036A54038